MDYNFFVAQSRAANDPRRQALYREQMLATYLDYFRANYAGGRAPLHIGHHFFAYQGGVYNEALKTFARTVCGLPEVRCTTYERLADFMDGLSAETLAAYRNGDFPRAERPALSVADATRGGLGRDRPGFPAEHRMLAGGAPVIAGKRAAAADHPMARHHERERVLADRGADRARRARRADLGGKLGIAGDAAHRHLQQRLPDPHLEVGADQHYLERPIGAPQFRIEDPLRERRRTAGVRDAGGVGPAASHVDKRGVLLARVRESETGEPSVGRHDQRAAERRGVEAVVDREAMAARLPFARRHGVVGDKQVVQPSG